jgi:peptide/nickel transport system ATP-binding protein
MAAATESATAGVTGLAASGSTTPLVRVRGLVKHFPVRGGVLQRTVAVVQAVDNVDLEIHRARRSGSSASRAAARRPSGA